MAIRDGSSLARLKQQLPVGARPLTSRIGICPVKFLTHATLTPLGPIEMTDAEPMSPPVTSPRSLVDDIIRWPVRASHAVKGIRIVATPSSWRHRSRIKFPLRIAI